MIRVASLESYIKRRIFFFFNLPSFFFPPYEGENILLLREKRSPRSPSRKATSHLILKHRFSVVTQHSRAGGSSWTLRKTTLSLSLKVRVINCNKESVTLSLASAGLAIVPFEANL